MRHQLDVPAGWVLVFILMATLLMMWRYICQARYFGLMTELPLDERRRFGWDRDNPVEKPFTRGGMGARRLTVRLTLWGPPPGLRHSDAALTALRRLRLSNGLITLVALGFLAMIADQLRPMVPLLAVVLGINLIILRPTPWEKG